MAQIFKCDRCKDGPTLAPSECVSVELCIETGFDKTAGEAVNTYALVDLCVPCAQKVMSKLIHQFQNPTRTKAWLAEICHSPDTILTEKRYQ